MVIGCTIREVDEPMAAVLWCEEIELQIIRQYRIGNIRHWFANIGLARRVLGYGP